MCVISKVDYILLYKKLLYEKKQIMYYEAHLERESILLFGLITGLLQFHTGVEIMSN